MDDVGDFNEIKDKLVNANVYYGRKPIMECLAQGANTVLTGRAADSAMFLAPLAYEFGWKDNDLDNLAGALWPVICWNVAGRAPAVTSSMTGAVCRHGSVGFPHR